MKHSLGILSLWGILVVLSINLVENLIIFDSTDHHVLSYEKIHESAIEEQVKNYRPAYSSLHTRSTVNLNGLYDFCLDNSDRGFIDEWFEFPIESKCDRSSFYRMPVPSAFNEITSLRRDKIYVGWLWYQRIITNLELRSLLDQKQGNNGQRQIFIQFENVNYMAIAWLKALGPDSQRAEMIGSHVGGYLPFAFNITSVIAAKNESSYLLTVAVSNILTQDTIPSGKVEDLTELLGYKYEILEPDFDFFHFAGILGEVNLINLAPVHITQVQLKKYGHTSSGTSVPFKICTHTRLDALNGVPSSGSNILAIYELDMEIKLPDNATFSRADAQIAQDEDGCWSVKLKLPKGVKKWEPFGGDLNHFATMLTARFHLNAYSCHPEKHESETIFCQVQSEDVVEVRFGLQSLRIAKGPLGGPGALMFRERKYNLSGFGMHHEQQISGRSMSLPAIMKDMYLLKQTHANVIRTSHYPYSREYLDACDENGILVIAECQAVGLSTFSDLKLMLHKQLLKEMMDRDHHHPSIIMWSIANEPQSQLPEARPYFRSLLSYAKSELAEYTKEADRPLTAAIAQSHSDDRIGDLLDVVMINRYYGWYDYPSVAEAVVPALTKSLAGWAAKHPDKPIIVSEFGAEALAGLHQNTAGLFSEEYQMRVLSSHERLFQQLYRSPVLIGGANQSVPVNFWGSMVWNFADFSTHESISRVGGNKKGVFTQAREPKLSVGYLVEFYKGQMAYSVANQSHERKTSARQ